MKKGGILNARLAALTAALGHTDCVMICDAGFPIPKGMVYVDLALREGVTSFCDCLHTLLHEAIFDELTVAQEMQAHNPEIFSHLQGLFQQHKWNLVAQTALAERANGAKFIIRSGELRPYSNILLYSASGVAAYCRDFVI